MEVGILQNMGFSYKSSTAPGLRGCWDIVNYKMMRVWILTTVRTKRKEPQRNTVKAENNMAGSEHEEGIPDADAGAQGTDALRKGNKPRREGEASGAPAGNVEWEVRVGTWVTRLELGTEVWILESPTERN